MSSDGGFYFAPFVQYIWGLMYKTHIVLSWPTHNVVLISLWFISRIFAPRARYKPLMFYTHISNPDSTLAVDICIIQPTNALLSANGKLPGRHHITSVDQHVIPELPIPRSLYCRQLEVHVYNHGQDVSHRRHHLGVPFHLIVWSNISLSGPTCTCISRSFYKLQ